MLTFTIIAWYLRRKLGAIFKQRRHGGEKMVASRLTVSDVVRESWKRIYDDVNLILKPPLNVRGIHKRKAVTWIVLGVRSFATTAL